MKRTLKVFAILILFVAFARTTSAQAQTTVTATVADPSGIPYAGGTAKAQINPSGPPAPCVVTGGNCVPIQGTVGPVSLDSTGSFTMNLYPNASITPAATTWIFTVCISPGVAAPFGTGPQCFSSTQTIAGGSQSLSTALSAAAPALTHSAAIGTQPTVIVDGVTITTAAQALAKLNGNGGVIDMRGCSPGSGNLGTFDIGNPSINPVTLLLGGCVYNFNAIVEEPQLHVIGIGSDGGTFLNYTGPSNQFMFPQNTQGHDLTSMIFTGLSIGNFGASTNVGCFDVTPAQVNTSADQDLIYDDLFDSLEASPPPCVLLHGTAAGLTGENAVTNTGIEHNTFFWNGTPISILGSVDGIDIYANTTDTTGVSLSCDTTGGVAIGISVFSNNFLLTTTPISDTGCGITASANAFSTGLQIPDTINGNPTVSQTGSATPGHVATFNAPGIIQDGGALPTAVPAIQSSARSTLASDIVLVVSTPTTVLTNSVTMPSTGCPCRVLVSYGVYASTNNQTWNTWVSDATNIMASAQTTGPNAVTTGLMATEISPVTYANSAVVTFTLTVDINGVGGTVKAAPAQGSGTNTWLSTSVLTSN